MENITMLDFLYHLQVKDSKEKAAAAINFSYEHWNDEEAAIKQQSSLFGPEIEYQHRNGHSYFRLKFINDKDSDLRRIVQMLESYESDYDKFILNEEENDFPVVLLTFVPMHFKGEYYMCCTDFVMWRTYSSKEGAFLEFVYMDESVVVYATDQINMREIDNQIKREIEAKEFLDAKAQEQKEYEAERQKVRENGLKQK